MCTSEAWFHSQQTDHNSSDEKRSLQCTTDSIPREWNRTRLVAECRLTRDTMYYCVFICTRSYSYFLLCSFRFFPLLSRVVHRHSCRHGAFISRGHVTNRRAATDAWTHSLRVSFERKQLSYSFIVSRLSEPLYKPHCCRSLPMWSQMMHHF